MVVVVAEWEAAAGVWRSVLVWEATRVAAEEYRHEITL